MTWLTNVWFVLSCTPRCPMRFFINMVPHCIYDWVLVYLLHNACVFIDIDWLHDSVWSLNTWMMWKWIRRVALRCDVTWQVVEWDELCLSKLYFVYMICISILSHFFLLVRNVITHSLCVVCVWILWWSRTLCSWEKMVRWMVIENLMLEGVGT